jgi:hypothetical protein
MTYAPESITLSHGSWAAARRDTEAPLYLWSDLAAWKSANRLARTAMLGGVGGRSCEAAPHLIWRRVNGLAASVRQAYSGSLPPLQYAEIREKVGRTNLSEPVRQHQYSDASTVR